MRNKVLITGGAGYIGSSLVSRLLNLGIRVTVLDDLWFGGDSIRPFLNFDNFHLIKRDLRDDDVLSGDMREIDCVVHLAAIVGFPACKKAGRDSVWQINVEGTKKVFQVAVKAGVKRLIFASSYSSYGESKLNKPVTEESPLHPKSLYAESKIDAERFLLGQKDSKSTVPILLRLATVFGVSPRPRFDLIVNQFVLEAYTKKFLKIYEGDFKRSFVHIRDVVDAIICVANAPIGKVGNKVFNVGSEKLNASKRELVELLRAYFPRLKVEYCNKSFGGDMRSIHVSFEKIRNILQFETKIGLEEGIEEIIWMLDNGMISDPSNSRYRNHSPILV